MRVLVLFACVLIAPALAVAGEQLAEARRLYNLGQYDAAERAARDAAANAATLDRARVVLGRIHLERYRRSTDPADLAAARAALGATDTRGLDARERVELAVGLAEALYFEEHFGAAAELFESAFAGAAALGPAAQERLLDWWATALDRLAQARQGPERAAIFDRIAVRMGRELDTDPGSTPAGYWVVAAARGRGDLDDALDAAGASWVRAIYARDRGLALRADLDRLVVQAILPDRAGRLPAKEQKTALAAMLADWEAFKERWSR
jgi:hypothetical protein